MGRVKQIIYRYFDYPSTTHKLLQLDQLMEGNSQSGPIKILLLMIPLNLLMKLGKMQQLRTQYTLLSE